MKMAYEFNDLKGFLFVVLFTIPLTTSKNINCDGKPFHCLNSTHFMICVDLGGDVSSTIDDFIIPCPPTTECHKSNRFECEFPKIEELIPPLHVIGVTAANDISILPPSTDSVSTTPQIKVTTEVASIENNGDKDLPALEIMSASKLEILESLKDEYTDGNEKIFDDSTITSTNFTNSMHNQAEVITINSGANEIMAGTDETYNVQSTIEISTDNVNVKALDTTTSAAGLFTSRSNDAEGINKATIQFIATDNSLGDKVSDLINTTPNPYINAERNFDLGKPPDYISHNQKGYVESSDHNFTIPKAVLGSTQITNTEISTTGKVPETNVNNIESVTRTDNPQTRMIKGTFIENNMMNSEPHFKANEHTQVLHNQALLEDDSTTTTPLEKSPANSSVASNLTVIDSNNTEKVHSNNNLSLSTPYVIPTYNRETINNIVTTDLLINQVTQSSGFLAENDIIIPTESSLYGQNNTVEDTKNIILTMVPVTPQQQYVGVDVNTTNDQLAEPSNVTTILFDESKSNSSFNEIKYNASSSNLLSNMADNVSEIILADNAASNNLHWGDKGATTFKSTGFNNKKTSETASTYNYDAQTKAVNWINIGTDETTPNTLDDSIITTTPSYDGTNNNSFSDKLFMLESIAQDPNVDKTPDPINNTDYFYGHSTKTGISTKVPIVDTSIHRSNNVSESGDINVPMNFEVKPDTVLPTTFTHMSNTNLITENITHKPHFAFKTSNMYTVEETTTKFQSNGSATEPENINISVFITEQNKINMTEYINEIIISTTEASNTHEIYAENNTIYTTTEQSIDNASKVQKNLINGLITTEVTNKNTSNAHNTSIFTNTTTDQSNTVEVENTTTSYFPSNSKAKAKRTIIYPTTTTELRKENEIKTETLMNPPFRMVEQSNILPIEVEYVPSFKDDKRSTVKGIESEYVKTEDYAKNDAADSLNLAVKSSASPEYITQKSVTNPITDITTLEPKKTEHIIGITDVISLLKLTTENPVLTASEITDTNDPNMATNYEVKIKEARKFISKDDGPGQISRLNKDDNTLISKSEINPTISTSIEIGSPMANKLVPTETSMTDGEPSSVIHGIKTSQSEFVPLTTEMIETQVVSRGTIQTLLGVPETTIEQTQTILNRMPFDTTAPTVNADDLSSSKKPTVNYTNTLELSEGMQTITKQNEMQIILSTTSTLSGRFDTDDSSRLIQETVHLDHSLTLPKVNEATTESEHMINIIPSSTSAQTIKLSTDDSSKLIQQTVNHDDSLTSPKLTEATTESEQYKTNKISSSSSAPTNKLSADNSSKLIQETVNRDDSLTSPKLTEATTESEQNKINKIPSSTSAPTNKLSADNSSKLIQGTVDTLMLLKVKEAATEPEQNILNRGLTTSLTSIGKPGDASKLIQQTVSRDDSLTLPKLTEATTESEQYMINKIPSSNSIRTNNYSTDESSKLIQQTVYRDGLLTLPNITGAESKQYMIIKIPSSTSAPTNKLFADNLNKLEQETIYHVDTLMLPKVEETATEPEQNTLNIKSSASLNWTEKPDDSLTLPNVTVATTEYKIPSLILARTKNLSTNDSSIFIQETVYRDDTQMLPKVKEAVIEPEQNILNGGRTTSLTSIGKPDDSSKSIQQTVSHDDSLTVPKLIEATTESELMINKVTTSASVPTKKLSTDDFSILIQGTVYRDGSLMLPTVIETTTEYMINTSLSGTSAPTNKLITDERLNTKLNQPAIEPKQNILNRFPTAYLNSTANPDDSSKLIQLTLHRDKTVILTKVAEVTSEPNQNTQNIILPTILISTSKPDTNDPNKLIQETVDRYEILTSPNGAGTTAAPERSIVKRILDTTLAPPGDPDANISNKLIPQHVYVGETLAMTKFTEVTTGQPDTDDSNKFIQETEHRYDTLTLPKGTAATAEPEKIILSRISTSTLIPPGESDTVNSNILLQQTLYSDDKFNMTKVTEVTNDPKPNTQRKILPTILVPTGKPDIEDSIKLKQETVHLYDTSTSRAAATVVPEKSILNRIPSSTVAPPGEPDTVDSNKLKPQTEYHGDSLKVQKITAATAVPSNNKLHTIPSAPIFQPNTDDSSKILQQIVYRGDSLKLQNITKVTHETKQNMQINTDVTHVTNQNMSKGLIAVATSVPRGKPNTDDGNKLTTTRPPMAQSLLVASNTEQIYPNPPSKTADRVNKPTSIVENNDKKDMRKPIRGNITLSEIIFTNGTVNNYSGQLRENRPENVSTEEALLQKSPNTHNISFTSEITSNLSNIEDINLETGKDTMITPQINVDIGADKNVNNLSTQEKYDSSTAYFKLVSQYEITSPNPLVKPTSNNTNHMPPLVTANSASYNRTDMENHLIFASDNTASRKTATVNKSNHVYSSVNASIELDNQHANNSEQYNISKSKMEESNLYYNLTEHSKAVNDNSNQQVYTVHTPHEQANMTIKERPNKIYEEQNLPNVIIHTDSVTSYNVSSTGIPFDCQSHTRGKYADSKDCRKFYTCIGKLQPLVGTCPNNTVFSEINKQCTRNLSHCVRHNQFRCLYEGRFSDYIIDDIYYICVKNNLHGFYRYKLQCLPGYHLNKDTVKCTKDEEISSQSASSISERTRRNSDQIITAVTSEGGEKSENDFKCTAEGKFPYSKDCRKYYVCSKNMKKEYRRKIKKCSDDEVYDKKNEKCTSAESNGC